MYKLSKSLSILLFLTLNFSMSSCWFLSGRRERTPFEPPVSIYNPVKIAKSSLPSTVIPNSASQFKQSGKIYYRAPYLFINDRYKGVHVFDNTDPRNPIAVNFIKVEGCLDMAVKGNALYVDNACDLVVLDISNPKNVLLSKRIPNVFETPEMSPDNIRHYIHQDSTIIGWKKK